MENPADKVEKSPLPVVAIDGARIKAVREAKKLTQLYVASVVGVTTDTISRWENNRYPSVRRDNAEKLAAALEVELAEILRREEAEPPVEEAPPAPPRKERRRALLLFLAGAALLAAAALFLFRRPFAVPMAERQLPRFGAPGKVIPVQVRISRREPSVTGLIVRERLPPGWRLVNAIPPAATGQADAEEVKWLIPAGSGAATIFYTVRVPRAAALQTTAGFSGEVVAHGGGVTRRGSSGGDRTVTVAGVHWADENGDGRIDDDEIMPAYYLTEEMKGLGLDWRTIEAVWSGGGYRWDPRSGEFEARR
ncbi:MAG: helix-turn-helix domain-containing protein [Geobacteraceae bacterium]|nr:helix-turn-helix domain-containing protein [Geobacteraceae bacterium]